MQKGAKILPEVPPNKKDIDSHSPHHTNLAITRHLHPDVIVHAVVSKELDANHYSALTTPLGDVSIAVIQNWILQYIKCCVYFCF